jgi:hypothetical protein
MVPKQGAIKMNKAASSILQGLFCASTGNTHVAAQHPVITMSAPVAESQITVPRGALEHRKSNTLTLYNVNTWEELLTKHNLLTKYGAILNQIHDGFNIGIHPITISYTPANSPSLHAHLDEYKHIIDQEFSSQQYLGPLSKSEVEELI